MDVSSQVVLLGSEMTPLAFTKHDDSLPYVLRHRLYRRMLIDACMGQSLGDQRVAAFPRLRYRTLNYRTPDPSHGAIHLTQVLRTGSNTRDVSLQPTRRLDWWGRCVRFQRSAPASVFGAGGLGHSRFKPFENGAREGA